MAKGGISVRTKGKFPRFDENSRIVYNPPEIKGSGPSVRQKGKFPLYIDGTKPPRFEP